MALVFNRDTLRAAYNFLNETPPFCRWNLPDGDDVEFRVVRNRRVFGWYQFKNGKHIIAISSANCGHMDTLLKTLCHELIHLHEENANACDPSTDHSKAFYRWAAQVCNAYGYDVKAF